MKRNRKLISLFVALCLAFVMVLLLVNNKCFYCCFDSDPIEPAPNVSRRSPTKVLILSYFRSGSTFIGEAFNKNPEAFYWFEPLHAAFASYKAGGPYKPSKGNLTKLNDSQIQETCHIVSNILNCRLDQLPHKVLSHTFATVWSKSFSLFSYQHCLQQIPRNRTKIKNHQLSRASIDVCLPLAIRQCDKANIRAVKTIRMAGYMIDRLLSIDPDIQIVHSVRDPRGLWTSARELGYQSANASRIGNWASEFCHWLYADYHDLNRLGDKFIRVRYEDLAADYSAQLKRIYRFLKRTLSPVTLNWFDLITSAPEDGGKLSTVRRNSTATAHRWQQAISEQARRTISNICSEALRVYQYNN